MSINKKTAGSEHYATASSNILPNHYTHPNEPMAITTAEAATAFLASLNIPASRTRKRAQFNRALLPSPEIFWGQYNINLNSSKGAWIMVKCLFHEDTHPSLAINRNSGGFICHSCGAKGGDVIAAYKLLNGGDFVTAAKALGAMQ